MKKISFLLAYSYLKSRSSEKNISLMIKICCVSIFIASGALALIMAIMNGFEYETHKKMQGIHADIIIRSQQGAALDYQRLDTLVRTEFKDTVAAMAPYATEHALLQSSYIKDDVTSPCILTGLEPLAERMVTQLESMIIMPPAPPAHLIRILAERHILIGKLQAQELGVGVGDSISLLYSSHDNNNLQSFSKKKLIIGGIFSTGIEELDAHCVFCSQDTFALLFPDIGISSCGVKLRDRSQCARVIENFKTKTDLLVFSWQELYPVILSALLLEKYAMFLILVLIMLIASMSIVALLFMFITYKKIDIALLKSMGMTDRDIHDSFMFFGLGVCICSSLCGVIVAWIISYIIDHYRLIALPDIYYVSYIPAHIDCGNIFLILCTISVISGLAVIFPLRIMKTISIADIFKQKL